MSATDIRVIGFIFAIGVLEWTMRVAAGRLAPRAAFGPMLFLVTRTPVLIAWAVGTLGLLILMTESARANGRDPSESFFMLAGISAFSGLGFAALTVGPAFFVVRAFEAAPEMPLEPGEVVLREVAANHFLHGEARGGKLLVTSRRLVFRPHRFNVQRSAWSARLEHVLTLGHEGTRFLLVDTRTDDGTQWLVVFHPRELAGLITELASLAEHERASALDGERLASAAP